MSRLRVLYAPRNIAGQPTEWAAAVRPHGVRAQVWSFGDTAFGLVADRVFDQDRLLADPQYRFAALADAVREFDVFHFQYGRSLLNPNEPDLPELWDLPLLRSLGKRVFMHWHGSDVRLRSAHMAREPDSYLADATVDEPRILAKVSIARRFCDAMFVSTPGLLDYVPDATLLPLCLDAAAWRADRSGPEPAVPTVAHIPSRRATKGSAHVDAALRPLAEAGLIHYRPLSGLTRDQVRAEFARADMVVDSMTIGDHGLVAIEAMASGAIALAHVHERNRARTPDDPTVEVTRHTLAEVARALAADPAERARLRLAGVDYVRAHHDRAVVGKLLADAYRAPAGRIVAGYPDWPTAPNAARLAELEAEVERLRRLVPPGDGAPPLSLRERVERRPAAHLAARRAHALAGRLRARLRR